MVIPIGDDQVEGGPRPFFSYSLIAINILVFLFQFSLDEQSVNAFTRHYGAIPSEILNMEDLFTLFTSIFLHAGLMHIAGNMLYLWIFADNIESTCGNLHFIFFYLLGGLAASLCHIFLSSASDIPTVGASGAISAIMGAYVVLFPKSRIKMLFIIFFQRFYISAIFFLGYWFVSQVWSSFAEANPEGGGVAWWAHIGGFLFGVIYAFLFFKNRRKTEYNLVLERETV